MNCIFINSAVYLSRKLLMFYFDHTIVLFLLAIVECSQASQQTLMSSNG